MSRGGFAQPLEVLHTLGVELQEVVLGAKFTPGRIQTHRYYVQLDNSKGTATATVIDRLADALNMPEAARLRAHAEQRRYASLRFFGVGETRGALAYRLYFGFNQTADGVGPTGSSIDWQPGASAFVVKEYTELRTVARAQALDELQTCLGEGDSGTLARTVQDAVVEITARADGPLYLTRVGEPSGPRRSIAFNYSWAQPTTLQHIGVDLAGLADAFGMPSAEYSRWYARSKQLRLVDIATGRGHDGAPFVTVYLSQPGVPSRALTSASTGAAQMGRDVAQALPDVVALWEESQGDPEICVAIIDGPVDRTHPCFAEANLVTLQGGAGPGTGASTVHGTQVASLIFGSPGGPVRGLVPRCRGVLLSVFADAPDGTSAPCTQAMLAEAIIQALDHGAHIINISAGQLDLGDAPCDPALEAAVEACRTRDVLVVAAAGNEGCDCVHWPGALQGVIPVGAMDQDGQPIAASNAGEVYRSTGLLAPGTQVRVAALGGGVTQVSGTSFAAPLVAGSAALLASVVRARGQTCSMAQVRHALLTTAQGCGDVAGPERSRLLTGRLALSAALEKLTRQGDTMMKESVQATQGAGGAQLQGCGCGRTTATADTNPSGYIYALGQLEYGFVSQARRDSFVQQGLRAPEDPKEFLNFLKDNPTHAPAVTWLLTQQEVPIYEIRPGGPYAREMHEQLRNLLAAQVEGQLDRISLPGFAAGTAVLQNGMTVPSVSPDGRGLFGWTTGALVDSLSTDDDHANQAEQVAHFLDRIYYEFRNVGAAPAERALNFAATNALQSSRIYQEALREGNRLETIEVEPSRVARPDSQAFDVKLTFFHPVERQARSRVVYRMTIDVSDVLPVTIGKIHKWHAY